MPQPAPLDDPFESQDQRFLQLFFYLIPVVGFFPALWTLYRRRGTRQERNLSRLVIIMALLWLGSYTLLGSAAEVSESLALPFLIANSVVTSSYFVVNLWLITRLWQRKPLKPPLLRKLGD